MSTRALQVECLLTPLYDYRNGAICSAYTVNFYAAGTSTAKNIWTEKEKTNPYTTRTLGSDGTVQVYGDGVYKIDVLDGDSTTVYQWDNVKIQHPNIAVLEKSGTYTATVEDDYILVTTAGGNVTINLYAAASFTHPLCIKNIGANSVIIDGSGAELIEGAATYTIGTQDAAVWLFSNGSTWYIANDVSVSATDAVNMVAAFEGAKKLTAKATSIDIMTNNEYLRQINAVGDGYVNIVKVNASNKTEVHNVQKITDGTNDISVPTNGMAAAKFMLGNSSTIAWFYLNTAPPGWKVTATGADSVLGVSGGANAYNANGGTAGGTWTQPTHTHTGPSHTHTGPSHNHTGPSHTHTGPSHSHAFAQSGSTAAISTTIPIVTNGSNIVAVTETAGGSTYNNISDITVAGGTEATGAEGTGVTSSAGTGATGAEGTGATSVGATAATYRPTASIGKLFQLDTA